MKYIIIFLIMFCVFLTYYTNIDKHEDFYIELTKQAEMLNDRIDRILYVKVLQEGDTLYFTSNDSEDTFWVTQDTSWVYDTILLTYCEEAKLEDLYLMDDGVLGVSKDVPTYPELYLNRDIFIYPDQFSGNTYVINAEGDTIFKYIKGKKQ